MERVPFLSKGKCLGLGLEPLLKKPQLSSPPLPWGEGLLKSGRQLGSKERLVHFSYLGWNVAISGPSQSVFLFYNPFDPIIDLCHPAAILSQEI